MSIQTRVAAGLAMLCLVAGGCRTAMDCTDGCARPSGSPLAGMRYDCSCESGGGQGAAAAPACGSTCDSGGCANGFNGARGCTACGDLYWNEWFNSPPALCQPCDCHGNYTGPGVDQYILPNASGRSGTPVGSTAPWLEAR